MHFTWVQLLDKEGLVQSMVTALRCTLWTWVIEEALKSPISPIQIALQQPLCTSYNSPREMTRAGPDPPGQCCRVCNTIWRRRARDTWHWSPDLSCRDCDHWDYHCADSCSPEEYKYEILKYWFFEGKWHW